MKHASIFTAVGSFPAANQGRHPHGAYYVLQDRLGLELTALIEDPGNASVQRLAQEARAKMAAGEGGSGSSAAAAHERSVWISPTPVSVKMRLFCLPYAGGVSENVFARFAPYLQPSRLPGAAAMFTSYSLSGNAR